MNLNQTPRGMRLHIGIFGKRNSGKSSLMNALTNQKAAIVSEIAGTTADPVYKSMEIHGIGPVVFIDTAGFDDEGYLGEKRVDMTEKAFRKTDVAIIVFSSMPGAEEDEWTKKLKKAGIPIIPVVNKADILENAKEIAAEAEKMTGIPALTASALEKTGIDGIRKALIKSVPEDYDSLTLTGGLASDGDSVLLVMPQDIQAPKNRLILPQVQTIRELLDRKCITVCCTADRMDQALASMKNPPNLIITDSQAFPTVWEKKPEKSLLTSFSILMAGLKGDIGEFAKGAEAISRLGPSSHVLIAEACTHAPLPEDIGREKIPAMLRKRAGESLQVTISAGADFPKDLSKYDLIIHCGACMFNRRYVLSRIEQAKEAGIPITNYGIAIAYMSGILDKISIGG
ncbi:MAG: [FeFe] hydrogenase H-cluster maturation GTPase HydF [bacterium]|nr:[FeFe] hydrogenase H-cluster maturation GTPase HydF [bacterium]